MKNSTLIVRAAAAGFLTVTLPHGGSMLAVTPAAADVSVGVSIGIGTFYDRLAPYGDWVFLNGATVWVPAARPAEWQPYTLGHWVYTRRHGWMWVSDEPFGWATYHYGRWGFSSDIGRYWVPGYRWGPAWVSWRRSDAYIGWSPLPVGYPDDAGVNVTIATVPDFYWQVVPAPMFLSVGLSNVIVRDRSRADVFIRNTRPLGGVRIVNNVAVDTVIDVNFVEKRTHNKVRVFDVEEAKTPRQGGPARRQLHRGVCP